MNTNGTRHIDDRAGDEDRETTRHLLAGAASAEAIMAPLDRASDALREVSRAFQSFSGTLAKIGTDTARAIADTVHLKRYLREFGTREIQTRAEVDALKSEMAKRCRREKDLLVEVRTLQAEASRGKKQLKKGKDAWPTRRQKSRRSKRSARS